MPIKFLNNVAVDSSVLYVDTINDRVGIGTTSPDATLKVQGPSDTATISTSSTPAARINNGGAISLWIGSNFYNYGYVQSIQDDGSNNLKPLSLQPLGGNVGIGTTSPGKKLDVAGEIQGTNLFAETYRSARTDGDIYIQAATATDFVSIGTQVSPNLMRIDGSGNVGIGTTSPAAKLHISSAESDPGDLLFLHNSTNAAGATIKFTDIAAGTSQFGRITYRHSDGQSQGGGASFHFTAEPDTVLVIGNNTNKGRIAVSSAGNVSEVDYGFKDDINTGIYRAAADTIGLVTAGSERMRITSAGNVGIGTTSPDAKLNITAGDNGAALLLEAENSNNLWKNITFKTYVTESQAANFSAGSHIYTTSPGGATTWPFTEYGALVIEGRDNANGGIALRTGTGNGQITRIAIKESGNVGIGTTSPTHLLTLETASSPGLKIKDTTQGATLLAFSQDSNSHIGTYSSHPLVLDTNSSERMRITSAGNVGIGTTSPSGLLDVSNGTNSIFIESGGTYPELNADVVLRIGQRTEIWGDGTGRHYLDVRDPNGNQNIKLNGEGNSFFSNNLGIGTTSPGAKLEVRSGVGKQLRLSTGATTYWELGRSTSTGDFEITEDSGDTYFLIDKDNGNVGIGTTSPSQKLHVSGNARVTGAYYDSNNSPGTANQVLISTVTGTDWVDGSAIPGVPDGSGTAGKIVMWQDSDTLTDSKITQTAGSETNYVDIDFANVEDLTITGDSSFSTFTVNAFDAVNFSNIENNFNVGSGDLSIATGDNSMSLGTTTANSDTLTVGYTSTRFIGSGNVGIGTTSPSQKLHVAGNARITGALYDSNNSPGTSNQILSSTVSGTDWVDIGNFGTFLDIIDVSEPGNTTAEWSLIKTLPVSNGSQRDTLFIKIVGGGWNDNLRYEAEITLSNRDGFNYFWDVKGGSEYNTGGDGSNRLRVVAYSQTDGTVDVYLYKTSYMTGWIYATFQNTGAPEIITSLDSPTTTQPSGTEVFTTYGNTYPANIAAVNNRVGIGTTSPSEKLHVVGSALIEGSSTELKVKGSGGYDTANIVMGNAAKSDIFSIDTRNDPGGNYTTLSFDSYQTTGTSTITLGDNYVNLGTAGSSRVTINSTGNVGIGTTDPAADLHIHDEGGLAAIRLSGTASGADNFQITQGVIGLNNAGFSIYDVDATASRLVIDTSGNVGIGTTDPRVPLQVSSSAVDTDFLIECGNTQARMSINNTSTGDSQINFQLGNTSRFTMGVDNSDSDKFKISGGAALGSSDRIVVDSTGNVGIATTSPGAKLDVDGNFKLSDFTATAVATSGSLSPNQNYQASSQDTLADLAVDPSGNVVRGMQEGTWTFTAAQLNTSLGNTLIEAPGVNKAVIVYESSWMIKYNATGAINANQRYEIRQASNTGIGPITQLPGAKINEILSQGQSMPGGGASAYGFYSRDVPADAGGRTFKTNTATTLHRNTNSTLPSGVQTISIKLRYRIYNANTF
jgi:hypothetical protein